MKKAKLFEVPRNTIIDISEQNLEVNGEKLTECLFENMDGSVGRCKINDGYFYLNATEIVKIKQ